jgi:DNA-binding transcriptional regulator YiaG
MVRLLIEDVTLTRNKENIIQIRFKGGTTATLIQPIPLPSYKTWETPPDIIAQIDQLIDEHTADKQIASILNEQGLQSGKGKPFSSSIIGRIRKNRGLKSRFDRLRERGMLTMNELAARVGVCETTVRSWLKHGLLRGHAHNDHEEYLFELPAGNEPFKWPGKKLSQRKELSGSMYIQTKEVQYEA